MFALGNVLVLAGYTLVYAACANAGVFAADPTAALFNDAYTGASVAGPAGMPSPSTNPAASATLA